MMKYRCINCNSENSEKLFRTYDTYFKYYFLRRCLECNSIFLTPNPSGPDLQIAYQENYYGGNDEKFYNFFEFLINIFRKKRAKRMVRRINQEAKILDIGCGNGKLLEFVSRMGNFDLYGIEIPGNAAERAKKIKNISLKIGSLDYKDFPTNFFNAISMYHVFEHLTEPFKYLDVIDRILKDNGVLIVSMPNFDSTQSKIFKGKWFHLDPPRHLILFKPKDFIDIMTGRGYTIIDTNYLSWEQNPFGWVQSILNSLFKNRDTLYEYFKGNKMYSQSNGKFSLIFQIIMFLLLMPVFAFWDIIEALFKSSGTVEYTFRKTKSHNS